jgi:hypothetical protein
MTLTEYLRSQRTLSASEVAQIEHRHDIERGEYAPPSGIVHHTYGESRPDHV